MLSKLCARVDVRPDFINNGQNDHNTSLEENNYGYTKEPPKLERKQSQVPSHHPHSEHVPFSHCTLIPLRPPRIDLFPPWPLMHRLHRRSRHLRWPLTLVDMSPILWRHVRLRSCIERVRRMNLFCLVESTTRHVRRSMSVCPRIRPRGTELKRPAHRAMATRAMHVRGICLLGGRKRRVADWGRRVISPRRREIRWDLWWCAEGIALLG